jgi:asparagine synthase (glutamine-hydrolysing)
MFAFALWDREARALLLARDRLGKKPLYHARTPGGLVFASEVKALLQHPDVSARVDTSLIPTFLAYRYVPGSETLFKDIECLPAGTSMRVTAAGASPPRAYWEVPVPVRSGASRDAEDVTSLRSQLRELLKDAVRLRMVADVPLGAFLSGGLDSSLIVALMSELHPEPVKTFSIGFKEGVSEIEHARVVARRFATNHHEVLVGAEELIEHMPQVLHARETPITEASDIPIWLLSRLARTEVTVVLSGEGSDEILAGYPKYAFERQFGPAARLLPKAWLRGAARGLPAALRRGQLALECQAQADALERHALWFGAFDAEDRHELLEPALLADADAHAWSRAQLAGRRFQGDVDEMQYLDVRHWLPANLLLRGDRMTMANSLELRCPFLDYRLVEFAAERVPLSSKIRGLSGKRVLQEIARELLPDSIVSRRKWGFKVPTELWFRGSLAGLLREVLLGPEARRRGYFREAPLRRLVDEHVSGRANNDKQLWILFQLELWHRMFVDRTLGPADRLELEPAAALSAG